MSAVSHLDSRMQRFTLDTIDSTNREAKRLLAAGRITGSAVITAREQTAGRGSRGRPWVSPRDVGVYLSVVDVPARSVVADLTLFTLAAGVACVDVLRERANVDVRIKPVNDLYVDGRKLGGILTEAVVERQTVRALITGIGINIRTANRPVAARAAEPVALQALIPAHAFAHLDAAALADRLAERTLLWHQRVWAGDADGVRAAWHERRIGESKTSDPDRNADSDIG